jgi:hypothetical protein
MTEWPSRVETMARCGGLAVDLRRRSNAASIFVAGETDAKFCDGRDILRGRSDVSTLRSVAIISPKNEIPDKRRRRATHVSRNPQCRN